MRELWWWVKFIIYTHECFTAWSGTNPCIFWLLINLLNQPFHSQPSFTVWFFSTQNHKKSRVATYFRQTLSLNFIYNLFSTFYAHAQIMQHLKQRYVDTSANKILCGLNLRLYLQTRLLCKCLLIKCRCSYSFTGYILKIRI